MREAFDRELETLHQKLRRMGELCLEAIAAATQTLWASHSAKKARALEIRIDAIEEEIGTDCLRLLLLQQPVAVDLRLISAVMKLVSDLERMGDEAADIAELAIHLPPAAVQEAAPLRPMAEAVSKMLADSMEAIVCGDCALARQVQEHDDIVDRCYLELRRRLLRQIREAPHCSDHYLDLFLIAKYFERMGDHAVNVAEWAEYALTGHHPRTENK